MFCYIHQYVGSDIKLYEILSFWRSKFVLKYSQQSSFQTFSYTVHTTINVFYVFHRVLLIIMIDCIEEFSEAVFFMKYYDIKQCKSIFLLFHTWKKGLWTNCSVKYETNYWFKRPNKVFLLNGFCFIFILF